MKGKKLKLTAIVMTAMLLLSGCDKLVSLLDYKDDVVPNESDSQYGDDVISNDDVSVLPQPVYGGKIALAIYSVDTLNPIATRSLSVRSIQSLIYNGLVQINDNLESTPNLASSYSISADGLTYTFSIKQNISFHDGSILTAADVDYTIKYMRSTQNPYTNIFSNVASSRKKGEYEYEFVLKQPNYSFLSDMDFPIMSKNSAAEKEGTFKVIGTGPYKMESEIYTGDMVLRANNKWYGGKTPYIDRVDLKLLPDKHSVGFSLDVKEIMAVTSNAVDYISYSPKSNLKMHEYLTSNMCFVGINSQREYLSDQLLRWCMDAAIDKEKMKNEVMLGKCEIANVLFYPSAYYNTQELNQSRYNVEKAKNILDIDIFKNNQFTKKQFEILVSDNNYERIKTAEYVRDMFVFVGIGAKVTELDFDEYQRRILAGDYDLFIGKMNTDNNGDYASLLSEGNMFGYQSAEMDMALSNVRDSKNTAEAKDAYAKLGNLTLEKCVFIPLYYESGALIYDERIVGVDEIGAFNNYNGIENWFLK